ncbi:hypothetical protein TNCV_91861 [Trichonephila clavipes]|nr:hypothetical protein TNCV_91861 [Trichonephila clavipes]
MAYLLLYLQTYLPNITHMKPKRKAVGIPIPNSPTLAVDGNKSKLQWNEKVSNHGSIPITIDCNVVAFIVFEEVRTNDSTSP